MNEGVVHLWVAPEWQLDESVEARYREFMSAEEREAERRFLVEGARRLHVLARGLQRSVLASCLPGADPAALTFHKNPKGRPALAPPFDSSGIEFNLAHTEGMVVMAVCAGTKPGVDIEGISKQVPLAAARRYFSAAEVAALDALPAEEQPGRFLRLWTLKEAYLKAIGTGIAGGLGSMTFNLEAGGCRFERAADADAARWQFHQYTLAPDYVVALACPPAPRALRIEWREFFAGEEREVSLVRSNLLWGSGQEQGPEA
jgi:4'-phosphopantetheinyl transferase